MTGYGMMGNHMVGIGLLWLLKIAAVAFIFGVVFWWTKQLVYNEKRKK